MERRCEPPGLSGSAGLDQAVQLLNGGALKPSPADHDLEAVSGASLWLPVIMTPPSSRAGDAE